MEWVSGIGRDEGGTLCVEAQWHDGSRARANVLDLKAGLSVTGTVRRCVNLDFGKLRLGDASEYLHRLGLSVLDASAQCVYVAETNSATVVIPSQLLVLGLFGPNKPLRETLLRPWGPTQLLNAVVAGVQLAVAPAPHRMLKAYKRTPATDTRMAWVLSYPSATAGWCSVYANALNGRFDVRLPKALAKVAVHGKLMGEMLLATRLQVLELTATEAPFEFAGGCAPRRFVFDERAYISNTHGRAAAPTADLSIAGGGRVVPLTDTEWARVEPLILNALGICQPVRRGRHRVHSLREILDCIRLKLGTPYSWSKCPGETALKQSASVLLSKLQRAGVWDTVTASP